MSFTEKATKSRAVVIALLSLLVVLYIYIHLANAVDPVFRILVSTFTLLIFFPGLLLRKYRAASLLCFVLLLHFMTWTQELFIPGDQILDSVATFLVVSLFTITMFYSRWQQRADVLESSSLVDDSENSD